MDGDNATVLNFGGPRILRESYRFSARYSPEAAGGAGCKLDNREIVATIIPERDCMVATSLLSNSWGVVLREIVESVPV